MLIRFPQIPKDSTLLILSATDVQKLNYNYLPYCETKTKVKTSCTHNQAELDNKQ